MATRTFGEAGAIRSVPPTAAHLGQGIAYPLQLENGRLKLSFGQDSVTNALRSILATQPGERVMQPEYGADVLTFEPLDPRTAYRLKSAILDYEPRVSGVDVKVADGNYPGELAVGVEYVIAGEATTRTLTQGYFAGPALRAKGSAT